MKRIFTLLIFVAVLTLTFVPKTQANSSKPLESLLEEDTVASSIRNILYSPRATTKQQLDSISQYVNSNKNSEYYSLRMAMLGGVLMRLTHNANVERIRNLFDSYRSYMEELPNRYFFYENWYFLVESYLFSGQEVTAAELARQLYLQADMEGDLQGKAFATYVLGMFYQMQNLNEYALEYYQLALPLFKKDKNWDLYDVCGINTMDVMIEQGVEEGLMDIFYTLDSLANETIINDMRYPLNHYNVLITKGISSTYVFGDDKERLKPYLDETRALFSKYSHIVFDSIALQTIERGYARLTGDIKTELELTAAIQRNMKERSELANLGRETKLMAECYSKLGDAENAAKYYAEYIELNDSLNQVIKRSAINHVAAEYNLDRLKDLNFQLTEQVTSTKKAVMWLLFGILMLILITLALAVFHYRQRAKDLKRVSEMKTAFIRGITHEINTPLNAVLGFSEVIANMANTPEQVNMAGLVKINSKRLVKVVNDTLYLSDYDSGTIIDTTPTMVNLAAFTNRVRDIVEEMEQCHFIELSGGVFLDIKVHEPSLEALLLNLMHNAVHHGEPPVYVDYSRNSDGKIVFRVRDSGEKLSREVQKSMFERFYKANSFTDGLGVGLSVAQIAADRIGATIEYNDKNESGNEFVVIL